MNAVETPSALAGEIAESFCASLAQAEGLAAPFPYFRATHLFPAQVAEALAALPLEAPSPASGRREWVKERLYVDQVWRAQSSLLHAVALALQSQQVASALHALCGAPLDGTYLRLEYAIDADGFWLEPHTDLGVKKFTGLIALSGSDAEDQDLGTDLYTSAAEPFGRAPFVPNAGTLFVPGTETWHGFAPRPIKGLRKSVILNYVGADWQSREQLAFPDRPIAL
ncbi:hypothetical protein [Methyloferula stellata]|uniref:hypothetical protein n=1 Tax=Methyloferula stellata TaxID=876270 RepID=UPI000372BE57|nr:hypothetical protein [Methyloferula stellata]